MLQAIRDKTSGWIAYLIIGLISIPFALWGINSYLGGGEEQAAAIVDGEEISPRQLDYAYTRYRERLSSVFGGRIPEVFNDENTLKEQALSQLIEERVLLGYIQDKGYRVGDTKLFENIQTMQMFQEDGRFSKELYQNQLASQGYSPALFEQELRRSQEMEQLNLAINATAFTLPVELEQFNKLKNQQRKLRTLTFSNQAETIQVTDQQVTDYYNEQSARFMDEAKVKLDYIELNLDTIKQSIEIPEEKLLETYEQSREQLTTPEIRSASHILLTVKDDEDQVKVKIDDLKKRLDQGEDFAALAKEFSQDPGSAEDGGDLGEVERGAMVKPFETALFELNAGQISNPVKTQFGWHLIKLHEISGGKTKSFEQARNEIELEMKADLAESQIYDLAENLASIGYEEPDSLLPAAEQLDLKVQTTDWFARSKGEGLAEEVKIREAAFSEEVLNLNRNSETIELSDNRIVIVHLNEHKKSVRQPLESVRDSIVTTLKKKAGRELAQTDGRKVLDILASESESLDEYAAKSSMSIVDLGYIKRSNSSVDADLLSTAFSLPKPSSGKNIFEGMTEVSGDYTIIELSDVRVETTQTNEGDEQDPAKTINSASANYEYQAVIKSLTEQAEIMRLKVKDLQ